MELIVIVSKHNDVDMLLRTCTIVIPYLSLNLKTLKTKVLS